MLRLFGKERPDVEISLIEIDLGQLHERFERDELDVAFMRRPVGRPIEAQDVVTG